MSLSMFFWLTVTGYMICAVLICRKYKVPGKQHHFSDESSHTTKADLVLFVASSCAFLHVIYTVYFSFDNGLLNISLSAMVCLVSLVLIILFLATSMIIPIRNLGLLMFPLTAISLVFSKYWEMETSINALNVLPNQNFAMWMHVLTSLTCYSFICMAAAQSILLALKRKRLKSHSKTIISIALPPLQTMEKLLYQLVLVGFLLLTLTLLSGIAFSQLIFGKPISFEHHTIFAVLGWVTFAAFLYKHERDGINSFSAIAWTLSGFLLVQFGYFGTKIIDEILTSLHEGQL